jgi:hypothetical protein
VLSGSLVRVLLRPAAMLSSVVGATPRLVAEQMRAADDDDEAVSECVCARTHADSRSQAQQMMRAIAGGRGAMLHDMLAGGAGMDDAEVSCAFVFALCDD